MIKTNALHMPLQDKSVQAICTSPPYWGKQWLEEGYIQRCKSTYVLAKECGVDPKTIYRWLIKHGIKTRPRGENLKGVDNYMQPGVITPFKGKRHAKKTRMVLSEKAKRPKPYLRGEKNGMYGMRGNLHPNWSGGITPYRQKLYNSIEAKKWFVEIYARDGRRCKVCLSGELLQVHHILPVRKYPLLALDVNNGIVLCKSCHDKTKFKEHRYAKKLLGLIKGVV
jgi:5-methylcytosine-specific restriction endonuclease McrA